MIFAVFDPWLLTQ